MALRRSLESPQAQVMVTGNRGVAKAQ